MIIYRASKDRGYEEVGDWLKSYHTFSFAKYYDPHFMGFRSLRVINQDWIKAQTGFPTHPHKNMEILTYVLKGTVQHRDSLGNQGKIRAGEIQVMHAGKGILHSEVNPSATETLELFQIWIQPNASDVCAGYSQQKLTRDEKLNKFKLIASQNGHDFSQLIYQDINIYAAVMDPNSALQFNVSIGRGVWVQVAEGHLEVNGQILRSGDGWASDESNTLNFFSYGETEFLLFDMA